jgi:hypothetical protein
MAQLHPLDWTVWQAVDCIHAVQAMGCSLYRFLCHRMANSASERICELGYSNVHSFIEHLFCLVAR